MLKRLYVDNFKCLVNFDFQVQPIQLILGLNGSGKSTAFDVLALIRDFVNGEGKASELFLTSALTRWQQRDVQTFEIEVEGNGGTYRYRLEIEHQRVGRQCRIRTELLEYNGRPLFSSSQGSAQLYHDDHQLGPSITLDWSQSGVSVLGERPDNQRLVWFRKWIAKTLVVQMNPFSMTGVSANEDRRPLRDLSNFASWYRHLVLEDPQLVSDLIGQLADVMEGFHNLRLEAVSENVRELKASVQTDLDTSSNGNAFLYGFDELSDGQRALIAIYAIKRFAMSEPCPLVCIDEPDNFVALAEIQPWLTSLCTEAEDHNSQILLISHHPELVDFLAPERASKFVRTGAGPTRVKPFSAPADSALTPSELVARGWDDE